MNSRNRFCLGSIDKSISRDHHLLRFIEEKDLSKCQAGTFLVGSIERNKRFDDARADTEEFTATVSWPNSAKRKMDHCRRRWHQIPRHSARKEDNRIGWRSWLNQKRVATGRGKSTITILINDPTSVPTIIRIESIG